MYACMYICVCIACVTYIYVCIYIYMRSRRESIYQQRHTASCGDLGTGEGAPGQVIGCFEVYLLLISALVREYIGFLSQVGVLCEPSRTLFAYLSSALNRCSVTSRECRTSFSALPRRDVLSSQHDWAWSHFGYCRWLLLVLARPRPVSFLTKVVCALS